MTIMYLLARGDKVIFGDDVFDIYGKGKAVVIGDELRISAPYRPGTRESRIPEANGQLPLFAPGKLFG